MAETEHNSNPQGMRSALVVPWLNPRRLGLGALAIVSILASPVLVVYEFVLGLVLVIVGYAARLVRSDPLTGRNVGAIGMALLIGPLVYTIAWLLGGLFNW